jgi:protein disulfide-isomerase A6
LKKTVKIGKIDCTVHTGLAQRFGVSGYPTIKYFSYGDGKTDSKIKDFNGAREASGIIGFANQLVDEANIPPEIHELTNTKVYTTNCQG